MYVEENVSGELCGAGFNKENQSFIKIEMRGAAKNLSAQLKGTANEIHLLIEDMIKE